MLVDQLRKYLGVKSFFGWCDTWPGFGLLSKKNRLALNVHSKL